MERKEKIEKREGEGKRGLASHLEDFVSFPPIKVDDKYQNAQN